MKQITLGMGVRPKEGIPVEVYAAYRLVSALEKNGILKAEDKLNGDMHIVRFTIDLEKLEAEYDSAGVRKVCQ